MPKALVQPTVKLDTMLSAYRTETYGKLATHIAFMHCYKQVTQTYLYNPAFALAVDHFVHYWHNLAPPASPRNEYE